MGRRWVCRRWLGGVWLRLSGRAVRIWKHGRHGLRPRAEVSEGRRYLGDGWVGAALGTLERGLNWNLDFTGL